MYFHIITKFKDEEKEMGCFHIGSSAHFTVFEEYINGLQKNKINSITFSLENLNEIKTKIKLYLDDFFQNEYEKKYTGQFRPKTYRPIEFCGVMYDLDVYYDSFQTEQIRIYHLIEEVIRKNGSLILHDESYRRK